MVPPETVRFTEPSVATPQLASVVETLREMAVGCPMVTIPTSEHPFASVMVQVYAAADRPEAVAVVAPLLHAYEYGETPPDGLMVADPVEAPLQSTSVEVTECVNTDG